jgi:hypothetical protein
VCVCVQACCNLRIVKVWYAGKKDDVRAQQDWKSMMGIDWQTRSESSNLAWGVPTGEGRQLDVCPESNYILRGAAS